MRNLLSKENRISSTFTEKAKRERFFYNFLTISMTFIGGFLLFEFMYELCNILGSVVSGTPAAAVEQLIRMVPVIVITIGALHMGIYSHRLYRANSNNIRVKGWKINGVASFILGAFCVVYIIIGLITRKYYSLVEGNPTWLFPLDMLIGGLVLMLIGFAGVHYANKLKKQPSDLPLGGNGVILPLKIVNFLFFSFTYFLSAFGLVAFLYGIFIMDWVHGFIFYNIMLLLVFLCSPALMIFYKFFIVEAKDEVKKKIQIKYAIIFLIANISIFILYLVSVEIQNEAPNLNAFGLLPVEFTASFNAFPIIYMISNLLGPVVILVNGLFFKDKKIESK